MTMTVSPPPTPRSLGGSTGSTAEPRAGDHAGRARLLALVEGGGLAPSLAFAPASSAPVLAGSESAAVGPSMDPDQLAAQVVFPAAVGLFAEIDSPITLRFLERFASADKAAWLSERRLQSLRRRVVL